MKRSKIEKFESQKRLDELNVSNTLLEMGVGKSSWFLDYGAGTGIFSIPAASMAHSVFAYDIDPEMLAIIEKKMIKDELTNIQLISKGNLSKIGPNSIDHILLVTVFHEVTDLDSLFLDFDSLLTEEGNITIIDFHKKETPSGPPVDHRISKQDVIEEFTNRNYQLTKDNHLGENFYLLSFRP